MRRANVLEPLDLDGARFDSVALNGVLHCLPATMEEKAAVFRNLRPFVAEGGALFGSTILGRGVETRSYVAACCRIDETQ
jgi:hypothetical protein